MNITYIESFIKSGANLEINLLRQCSIMFSVFLMISTFFANQSIGIIKALPNVIFTICIINIIAVFVLTSFEYTTKKRILINLIFPSCIIINSLLFAIILFTVEFGYNMYLFCIVLPPIFLSILILICTIIKIKKEIKNTVDTPIITYKKVYIKAVGIIGAIGGLVGMMFSKRFLKNYDQGFLVLLVVVMCELAACSLTFSIKNIMKLYYLKKLKKNGININIPIQSGIVYLNTNNQHNQGTVL